MVVTTQGDPKMAPIYSQRRAENPVHREINNRRLHFTASAGTLLKCHEINSKLYDVIKTRDARQQPSQCI
ncbi:UNVERIFIED_CONTAM: hypothetical protein FKN15_047947 [Acipenser sinensis]